MSVLGWIGIGTPLVWHYMPASIINPITGFSNLVEFA